MDAFLDKLGLEDDLLVEQALGGDEGAFRALIERYQGMVFGLCMNLLGNVQEAEDAAQDAFVLFHRSLHRYRAGGKLANWLYTIALNVSRKILRRRKILRFFSLDSGPQVERAGKPPEYPSGTPSVERMAEGKEEAGLINGFVSRLPDDLRIPIVMRYYQGLEEGEIAPLLGISPGNLRVRLHRGRMKLWEGYSRAMEAPVTPGTPGDRQDRRR